MSAAVLATLLAALAALALAASGNASPPHRVCTHWIGVVATVPGTGHGHSGRVCSSWKTVPQP